MNKSTIELLYVEDNLVDQMAFKRFDKETGLGMNYTIAGNFSAAETLLQTRHFDCIVTDYFLGDGTAFDILRIAGTIPVIFVTGAGDEEIAIKALHEGAWDYLVKDINYNYLKKLPVTVQKTIERRITEEEIQKLTWVASKTDNLVAIADKDGCIEWINEGFTRVSGYEPAEVIGTSAEVLRRGEKTGLMHFRELYEKADKTDDSHFVYTYESKNYTKEGKEFWVHSTLSPVLNEKKELIRIIAIDSNISELKRTEEALIAAKKEAEEAKYSEELFLANTSHEIRTPMNGVLGMVELLLLTSPTDEQLDYLQAIKHSAGSLLLIINDILDFSKIRAGSIEFETISFNPREIIQNLIKNVSPRVNDKLLCIKCDIDESIPEALSGDPVRLNQILLNLLGNAIKFTEQGEIQLAVRQTSREQGSVNLLFEVKDSGIGIPADKLDTIFESFKQAGNDTTRKYGGTGLGLSITQKLVEAQNGSITVQSEVGKGSVFSVNLCFEIGKPSELKPESKPGTYRFENARILIVEDNLINQKVAANLLRKWNISCEIADNGILALDKLSSDSSFDLILMDIRMPEMDGIETTRRIRSSNTPYAKIPIIAMTASAQECKKEYCEAIGMNDYLIKPFQVDQLSLCISRYLRQNRQEADSATSSPGYKPYGEESLVNLDGLKDLADGDVAFLHDILSTFIRNTPGEISRMKDALEKNNYRTVGEIAHKLKSSVALIGINSLRDNLADLQHFALNNIDTERIPSLVSTLDSVCHKALIELEELNSQLISIT